MTIRLCEREGCGKPHRARGLCVTHYNDVHLERRVRLVETPCSWCSAILRKEVNNSRARRYCGYRCRDEHRKALHVPKPPRTPTAPLDQRGPIRKAIETGDCDALTAAIRRDSVIDESSGCWVWSRRVDNSGYPRALIGGRTVAVHRLSLEARLGQPLGGQAAHHTCANRRCVNPEHLQPVTHADNVAEMLARTYMVQRIVALQGALAQLCPDHPLLVEVSVSRHLSPTT